jgi:hypothetical protein
MQRLLDVGQGVEWGELPIADFGAATVASKLQKILLITVVVVTKTLAAEGGRTAGKAIFFKMAAETKGHGSLQKTGC